MKTTIAALLLSFIACAFAALERPINPGLAKQALVVIRAKKISESKEVDKYRWYEVQVIEVYENRAEQIFLNQPIKLAALSYGGGMPDGISTLYIKRYNEADKKLWELVGVSHNSK